jgi:hypothetical protein
MEVHDMSYIFARDVERRVGWKPGRAERLAKQRRLPHYVLPNGDLRFVWAEIEPLIVHVPEVACASKEPPPDDSHATDAPASSLTQGGVE